MTADWSDAFTAGTKQEVGVAQHYPFVYLGKHFLLLDENLSISWNLQSETGHDSGLCGRDHMTAGMSWSGGNCSFRRVHKTGGAKREMALESHCRGNEPGGAPSPLLIASSSVSRHLPSSRRPFVLSCCTPGTFCGPSSIIFSITS